MLGVRDGRSTTIEGVAEVDWEWSSLRAGAVIDLAVEDEAVVGGGEPRRGVRGADLEAAVFALFDLCDLGVSAEASCCDWGGRAAAPAAESAR